MTKTVPVEPTEEMIEAAGKEIDDHGSRRGSWRNMVTAQYKAMLSAAPAERDADSVGAWKSYALHQEFCQVCADCLDDCETGKSLKALALANETADAPESSATTQNIASSQAPSAATLLSDEEIDELRRDISRATGSTSILFKFDQLCALAKRALSRNGAH